MAAHISVSSIFSSLLPRLSPSAISIASRSTALYTRELTHPLLPRWSLTASIQLNIPELLGDIWDSVLRAVPKKKTSHMKKRHRQLAGKALKDVNALNHCSACGHVKKAHHLCPYCVDELKTLLRKDYNTANRQQARERATQELAKEAAKEAAREAKKEAMFAAKRAGKRARKLAQESRK